MVDELLTLLQVIPTETHLRTWVAQTLSTYFNNEQQAIDLLQAGLMIDPLDAELHRVLGEIYTRAERLDEARAALNRSLELAPDNPNSYYTFSALEKEVDNLPAALDWLRQASLVDRQDHEMAAMIAIDLYRLRLPEEGDYWLARVQALAPSSGLARSLQVERAAAREEPEEVIELASAVIADQVEPRHGAFGRSLYHYSETMMREGKSREAYDFLTSVRPEITEYGRVPPDMQGLVMQWNSIGLMSGFESFENRKAAWQKFSGTLEELGFPWKKDPTDGNVTWDALVNGDVERAVDHYLEYELNEPLAKRLDRHRKPYYAVYAPVYEEPRVAVRLAEDARRFAALREEVRTMLQRPEWNNP
jgi:tetratricopeptide (TPR) repeat protein